MIRLFRILVVTSLAAYFVGITLGNIGLPWLDQGELDVLSWNGYGAAIEIPSLITWAATFIWIPVAIGMYLFKAWARRAYLILTLLFVVLDPFEGMFTATGIQIMFFNVVSYLDGAILALAYFSSIGEQFSDA